MFYEATSFDQVRRYVKENIELFSCFSYDRQKFADMQADFNNGQVTYLLFDGLKHGYVRILSTDAEESEEDREGLVDIVIPRDLGDHLEDLAEYARDHGFTRLYLNAEVPWISGYCDGHELNTLDVEVPEKNVLRHFEAGSGEYSSLVDLLQMYD